MLRERLVQLSMLAVASLALACAALLSGHIESERRRLKLVTATAGESTAKHPKIVLLRIAPGGLRAPFLAYLWIRSQQLKQDGKFFDAKQLRDLICEMTPHSPGVWGFCAWDMAWNISVATHTPQERWMWISNGISLLRDRGLYYNPNDLMLHRELAWIFFSKMGQYTDEMHRTYKRRWAGLMHRLLGAPPFSDSSGEAIKAFRPIVDAPDSLDKLLADAASADFVERLDRCGVRPNAAFLEYYNRFSDDPSVSPPAYIQPKVERPGWLSRKPAKKQEEPIAHLMRSGEYAAGRAKVLAFVRRKILVEKYRMDPKWMLELMEKFGPLDWRNVNSHAIYWSTLGLHRAEGLDLSQINALNTDRILLGGLKYLTRTGLLYYTADPNNPEEPRLDWQPDWRFVEPTHQEYLIAQRELVKKEAGDPDEFYDEEENKLRDAHLTFLSNVVQQMYFGGREDLARKYYDEIRNTLKATGEVYKLDLHDFVREKRRQTGTPTVDMTAALTFSALRSAYRALAGGNQADYVRYRTLARRAHNAFVKEFGDKQRLRPPSFRERERKFLVTMLVQPRAVRLYVPLVVKARLYNSLSLGDQQGIYPYIAERLARQCQAEGIEFERAFPAPPPKR